MSKTLTTKIMNIITKWGKAKKKKTKICRKKYLFISKQEATYQILLSAGMSPGNSRRLSLDRFDSHEFQHKFYL
jgi:hypothetical protein